MKSYHASLIIFVSILLLDNSSFAQTLRAPAYPLITHDPYFSIWSMGDKLNETTTKHWTGRDHPLIGIIEVDGAVYQFCGASPVESSDVLATAQKNSYPVKYTQNPPEKGWEKSGFSDALWKEGNAPFGDGASSNPVKPNSDYTKEIWYRRDFTLTESNFENLMLNISYDDDVEVYLNGVKAFDCQNCYQLNYEKKPISVEAKKALRPGRNVMAVHCINPHGGAYIDAGLVEEKKIISLTPSTQKSVQLTATQTKYEFQQGATSLVVTFTSPLLLDQLEVVSRPASYVTFNVTPLDNKTHNVKIWFGFSGLLSVNEPYQEVIARDISTTKLFIQRVGSAEQAVLNNKGDDVRIDWGYAFMVVPRNTGNTVVSASVKDFYNNFKSNNITFAAGQTSASNKLTLSRLDIGSINKTTTQHVIVAYDDEYSVQYFGKNLRPWWRRNGMTAEKMLEVAENDYQVLMNKCEKFDKELFEKAKASGGNQYAELCALAYRQAIAAHKIVANENGELLFFSKENFSNGSIGTVDVTYPSAPLFLLYNTELLKGMLRFIFEYSENGKWTKPFAAHDLGTYPLANGQTYPEDMPVEESGNMLILTAAIAERENNASFAKEHWATLKKWAEYLRKEGFDPANQLCTDDFAGHLARNANLSIKSIVALACYGKMAGMIGEKNEAAEYSLLAKQLAEKWTIMAKDNDHFSLAFEKKDSWSQKYNLVWDKLLRLNVFPSSIRDIEINYYLSQQNKYGLPLDSRRTYTKSDWIIWTATLASSEKSFQALITPVWKFVNETPDRIPLSDWHETIDAKHVGFRARSVVGGYFIKILEEELQNDTKH